MRAITEVGTGDYVKVGPDRLEKIATVEKTMHPDFPEHTLPKRWTVITESGRRVSMYEALAYLKKEDVEK